MMGGGEASERGAHLLLSVVVHEAGQVEIEQGLEAHGDALDGRARLHLKGDAQVEQQLVEVRAHLVHAESGVQQLCDETQGGAQCLQEAVVDRDARRTLVGGVGLLGLLVEAHVVGRRVEVANVDARRGLGQRGRRGAEFTSAITVQRR